MRIFLEAALRHFWDNPVLSVPTTIAEANLRLTLSYISDCCKMALNIAIFFSFKKSMVSAEEAVAIGIVKTPPTLERMTLGL